MDEHPDLLGEHVGVGHRDVRHGGPRHPIHRLHWQLVLRPRLLPRPAPAAGNTNTKNKLPGAPESSSRSFPIFKCGSYEN